MVDMVAKEIVRNLLIVFLLVLVMFLAWDQSRAATVDLTLPPGDYMLVPVQPYTVVTIQSTPVDPPVLDTDGDGVNDDIDQCPDTPFGDDVDATGCTVVVVPPPVDTDGDGVPDDVDQCPTEPAQTADGCPVVIPPPSGDLAATVIGQAAATLSDGQTILVKGVRDDGTDGPGDLFAGWRPDGTVAPRIDEWTSSAYWYPGTQCSYFIGLRQSYRFIRYCAEDNRWSEIDFYDKPGAPPQFQQFGHQYERNALDRSRGHFYVYVYPNVHRYDIATDTWQAFEVPDYFGEQVFEWHPGLDMLVNLQNGKLTGWRDGQLFDLGASPVDGYHGTMRYNTTRGDMMMMGGNESPRTVAIYQPDGTVVQKADAPFDFGISVDDLTFDPITGNYIVSEESGGLRRLWEYQPDIDEWRMIGEWGAASGYPLNWYLRNVPIVIEELGVISWQTEKGMVLHRPGTLFTQPEPPVVVVPPVVDEPPVAVEPPTEPESVADYSYERGNRYFPAPVLDTPGSLLQDQAATMQPGEWRNIRDLTDWPGKSDGVSFKEFQAVVSETSGADGMGWTQTDLIYDDGHLYIILNRSGIERAFLGMEPNGDWWRINEPEGYVKTDRRPFNKQFKWQGKFCHAPNDAKVEMGYFICTPLDNPGVFSRYGIPIGDDQMDTVGNFAMTYVPEWGRFYAYTPGGKLYTWAVGEDAWTRLDEPGMADFSGTGFAGLVLWNPIREELVVVGGQVFGDTPTAGMRVARITSPLQQGLEVLPDMAKPDGSPLVYTAAQNKIIVNPRDGSYLHLDRDKNIYRNDEVGGTYEFYGSVDQAAGWQLGPYELYAPFAILPDTDVIVFVSHIRGVVLHRLG